MLYDNYEDVWLWWEVIVNAYRKNVRGWNQEQFIKYKEAWYRAHPLWFRDGRPDNT